MTPVRLLSFLLLFVGLGFQACQGQGSSAAPAADGIFQKLDAKSFAAQLEAKAATAQLIDVRTPGECAQGKIGQAANLDFYAADFQQQVASLDKSRPVFLYCASGVRSAKASNMLKDMGFKEVYDLKGGYRAWSMR